MVCSARSQRCQRSQEQHGGCIGGLTYVSIFGGFQRSGLVSLVGAAEINQNGSVVLVNLLFSLDRVWDSRGAPFSILFHEMV